MKIKIVDAGCGVGKTTALINHMNNDKDLNHKYLFITPFLSEVERIKQSCMEREFVSPESLQGTKLGSIKHLLKEGRNVATTHALFKRFDNDMVELIKSQNYTLVMDEVAEVIEELPITRHDLKVISDNYIWVNPSTKIIKWIDGKYEGKFEEYKNLIQMNGVFAYTDNEYKIISLLWLLPFQIFEAFKEVYILTYMFEGQIQKGYFDYYNATLENWYVKDFQLTSEKQIYDYSETKKLINVCHNEKLNYIGNGKYALSKAWFSRNKNTNKMVQLKNNIYNYFRNITNSVGEYRLWTTFKDSKHLLKKKGFTSGFAPINSRATNEYGHCNVVAYIGNRFMKPTVKNFFLFNGLEYSNEIEDKFALSELVQFVYRSAIRNNQSIDIYIPSRRMRELFEKWLQKPNE